MRYGPNNPPGPTCSECDAELEPDEPQTCYFTGRGPCGDCRDPRTNEPPYPGGCFAPLLCDQCKCYDETGHSFVDHPGPGPVAVFWACENCGYQATPEDLDNERWPS